MTTVRNRAEPVWSLAYELGEIEAALAGVAQLLEAIEPLAFDPRRAVETLTAALAVTHLLQLRVRDLGRVLTSELDPARLRTAHNAKTSATVVVNRGEDVVFGAAVQSPSGAAKRSRPKGAGDTTPRAR